MAVSTVMSAIGLAALVTLPAAQPGAGPPAPSDTEAVPGAGDLHVTVQDDAEERLSPGDRVRYTVKVRNSGYEPLPDTEIVQFLPPTMRHVSDTGGGDVDEERSRVTWVQALEAGERASFSVTTEITSRPEGASHTVATVCTRPEPGAVLVACTASAHQTRGTVSAVWAAAGLLLALAAAAAGGLARYRSTRRTRTEPETEPETGPEPEPGPETEPEQDPPSDHAPEPGTGLPGTPARTSACQVDTRG